MDFRPLKKGGFRANSFPTETKRRSTDSDQVFRIRYKHSLEISKGEGLQNSFNSPSAQIKKFAVEFYSLQPAAIKHTLHSQMSSSDVKLADHEPT